MLANSYNSSAQFGSLHQEVQKPATFRQELVDFISRELPNWRDRADRPAATAETVLTSQLCAHLNSAARHSDGWDLLQFRVEEPDEAKGGRKIDLVASPAGTEIMIEGRRHVDFDNLMPIECKRLPTPSGSDRDEREYVISGQSTTGGIQRFKMGNHGAAHAYGAMIGYVQQETRAYWAQRIKDWIEALVAAGGSVWTAGDLLSLVNDDDSKKQMTLQSVHHRDQGLQPIELRHLWISLN
jgi:hypothetical protein